MVGGIIPLRRATSSRYDGRLGQESAIIEIANSVEAVQDGRIHIEKINGPFLFREKGTPAEYKAGLELAIERSRLWKHESGTFVRFTQAGADLFA